MGTDIDPEIKETFITEADGLIAELDAAIASLKVDPGDGEAVKVVHRAMHTLKGTGALLGFQMVASVAGPAESVANRIIQGEVTPGGDVVAALDGAYGFVKTLVDDIKTGNTSETDLAGVVTALAGFLS